MYRRSAARASLALAGWMLVHSALASERAKQLARRRFGERRANGLYRLAYNALAIGSFAGVTAYVWHLPDRCLYSLRGAARVLMHGGQAVCGIAILASAWQVGPLTFSGLRSAWDLLFGRPISSSPVAQHPLPAPDARDVGWTGPYRLSRHPLNYFMLLAYWLSPVMTVKWAVFGAVSAVYMVLGSMHEGRRLLRAYGERYQLYRERAPELLIRWRGR